MCIHCKQPTSDRLPVTYNGKYVGIVNCCHNHNIQILSSMIPEPMVDVSGNIVYGVLYTCSPLK